MYEVFDDFLRTPTWHTKSPRDMERFYSALRDVVDSESFQPGRLGEYMDRKRESQDPAVAGLNAEAYAAAKDHYVAEAEAISAYVRATCP